MKLEINREEGAALLRRLAGDSTLARLREDLERQLNPGAAWKPFTLEELATIDLAVGRDTSIPGVIAASVRGKVEALQGRTRKRLAEETRVRSAVQEGQRHGRDSAPTDGRM